MPVDQQVVDPEYDVEIVIDPGASGGIVANENETTVAWGMPATEDGVRDVLETYKGKRVRVTLEKVGGFTKAKGGQPGSSMFNFGLGVGILRGICKAYRWELREVTPQSWIKGLGIKRDGATNTEWKNYLKSIAVVLFPNHKITLKTADAFLILHHIKPEAAEIVGTLNLLVQAPRVKKTITNPDQLFGALLNVMATHEPPKPKRAPRKRGVAKEKKQSA